MSFEESSIKVWKFAIIFFSCDKLQVLLDEDAEYDNYVEVDL